ncbi:ankyrin repeat and LEM domain-containing protein 2 [Patella vulgata]|uniref:ankyrin repeat and LEM domain-containing protein 2 n=1 Tax=Patella vulgata TaxID=6465 RepID=UPI0024A938C5|nr:ankyrin repeat and LEM domain-containing protein 2 [Patella vulgata]
MEDILQRVKQWTDPELRENFEKYGEKVGPLTATTRQLFQKRLAKKIFLVEHPGETESSATESSDSSQNSTKTVLKNEEPQNKAISVQNATPSMFYAVCLPKEEELYEGDLVFVDKMAALNLVKKYKGSRFKVFRNRDEAQEFTKPVKIASPVLVQNSETGFEKTSTGIAVEKSAFKGPKTAELVALRRTIERGDFETFSSTVWENPRYLISSADTPVILHEGLRYNALHMAAISNKPTMCKLVLKTVSNPEFTEKLYCFSHESQETKQRRIDFVFDLYLNMPDKGNGESPLHFACKFGFADVVRALLEHPGIDRNMLNKHGETPLKVVCTRCKNPTPELKAKIEELLQGLCYVPLLRAEDNTTAPHIGQPWSPDNVLEFQDLQVKNPTDPHLAIRAFAGPMSPSKAQLFHRQWTTPPSPSPNKKGNLSNIRREDGDKGLERVGRQIAQDMHVPWSEYWEFLDAFVDFSTEKGISVLENYLTKQLATNVYKQWVKAHSTLINNVCLDSTIASEYSTQDSFTEQNSNLSVDSEASPLKNDLFRHNKIDRDVVKDFNNSDNEISEVFALNKGERLLDSSLASSVRSDLSIRDVEEGVVHTFNPENKSSRPLLQPPRLKYGIAAPETSINTQPILANTVTQQNRNDTPVVWSESDEININLTDEIKLSTPSKEPCQYDFEYSPSSQTNQTSTPGRKENCPLQAEGIDSPDWRDARVKSENSEDSFSGNPTSPDNELSKSSGTPDKKSDLNLDDSVLKGFQKLQLGSSDDDSFRSAVSDVFSTPNNRLEMSFNSQLTNLCDDLKQKLIFTPRNRLSRTVSVVSSLADNQETLFLQTKQSNFNFEMMKTLSNFKPSTDFPVPVLLVIKSESSGSNLTDCDILTDCVIFESIEETNVVTIRSNLIISVATQQQKDKLLSVQSSMIMSLCINKDDVPSCVELSVPALLTRLDLKDSFFILGQRASKLDQDIFRALVADDKDMSYFPLTGKWRRNVTTLQADNQQSWPSPARIRKESRLSGEFLSMNPLVMGNLLATPSSCRYSSPINGQRSSLSPSVFQFTPRTSRLTSSPRAPRFNLEKHLEESTHEDL